MPPHGRGRASESRGGRFVPKSCCRSHWIPRLENPLRRPLPLHVPPEGLEPSPLAILSRLPLPVGPRGRRPSMPPAPAAVPDGSADPCVTISSHRSPAPCEEP